MPINRKTQKPVKAGNLHYPNETHRDPEESGYGVENNMDVDTLTDPEETEGGDTHFRNEDKTMPAKNPRVGVEASKGAKSRLKAAAEDDESDLSLSEDPDASKGPNENQTFKAGDHKVNAADDCGGTDGPVNQQNLSTLPNDVDPAEGYLPKGGELNAADESEEDAEDDDEEDLEVNASEEFDDDSELPNANAPQQMLEGDADWNEDGEDDLQNGMAVEGDSDIIPETGDDALDEEEITEDVPSEEGDAMDLLDVDGTPDDEEDVAFATMASTLMVMRGVRVIAYMTPKIALKADKRDVYMTDEFHAVTAAEISANGLRQGLKNMGYQLAKVNVASKEVANRRVEAKVRQVTAAQRRVEHTKAKSMEQCLALAAVGINRNRFQGHTNQLRAALEDEFAAMGVRGASKVIRAIFASHGVSFAKDILTVAQKIVDMPVVARNSLAETLNMTTAGLDDDSQMFGNESTGDFGADDVEADAHDDAQFAEDFDEGIESPNSITAALSRPVVKKHALTASARARTSVTANAILNGDVPLPFGL